MRIFSCSNAHDLRLVLRVLAAASLAILGAALIAQYGFHLPPCHLCLLQRYPYVAVVVVAGVASAQQRPLKQYFWVLLACITLFLVGAGIAGYHTLVEAGIITGPSGCVASGVSSASLDDLRAQIMDAPLVSCDQPLGHIFGVSLAGWSFALYAFLTVYASYIGVCARRLVKRS